MTQHLKHLRDALLPVHESSYVPPRAERVTVDRRDLRALLADYDAAAKNELLHQFVSHMWSADIKYNRDNSIREIKITVKDTCTMSPQFVDGTIQRIREFVEKAPGYVL
jgi:hypothetical protein